MLSTKLTKMMKYQIVVSTHIGYSVVNVAHRPLKIKLIHSTKANPSCYKLRFSLEAESMRIRAIEDHWPRARVVRCSSRIEYVCCYDSALSFANRKVQSIGFVARVGPIFVPSLLFPPSSRSRTHVVLGAEIFALDLSPLCRGQCLLLLPLLGTYYKRSFQSFCQV